MYPKKGTKYSALSFSTLSWQISIRYWHWAAQVSPKLHTHMELLRVNPMHAGYIRRTVHMEVDSTVNTSVFLFGTVI